MALPMTRPSKRKNGMYYLTKRVPADLIAKVGLDVINRSLHTKDPAIAKVRINKELQSLETEWAYLRSELVTLTHKEVVALTRQRYDFFTDQFGDNPPNPASAQNELEMRTGVENSVERLKVWYERAAIQLLKAHGVNVCQPTREMLWREIHRTDIQSLKNIICNAEGDYTPDPLTNRFPEWSPPKSSTESGIRSETSFDELFSLWEREHRAANKAEGTIKDYRQKWTNLSEFISIKDAAKVTKKQIIAWSDKLRFVDHLSAKTVRDKYLTSAKAIFQVASNRQVTPANPARGYTIKVQDRNLTRPKGFTDEEAVKILTSSLGSSDDLGGMSNSNKTAIRWVPWICAYTGARVGEIAQLRKEDLIKEYDIPSLRITPEAGTVKTREYRNVPIHPHLVELGLLEFIVNAPDGPLFFVLKNAKDDPRKRSESVAKKVGKWVRNVVGVEDVRVAPNHGWRHRFKTIADDVDIPPKYSDAIQGHRDGKASSGYGERTAKALYREIQKMPRYDVEGIQTGNEGST